MPKIIIQTSPPGGRRRFAVLSRSIAAVSSPPAASPTGSAESDTSRRSIHDGRRRASAGSRRAASTLAAAVAALLVFASPAAAHGHGRRGRVANAGDVVRRWYDITDQTVNAAAWPEPVTQSRAWSVSWLAAARAERAPESSVFSVAAFAQALHDTLVEQVPGQQSVLDADLASTLATLPNTPQKSAGIASGQRQATAVLAQRAGDGLDTASVDTPYTPPPAGSGVWQPTPPTYAPAIRAGQGHARPFLLAADNQFDPGPPPSLNSALYRQDLAEVRSYGRDTSAVRTAQQTDVAKFWEPAINIQYVQILRDVLADTARSLAWDTRFVAAFNVVTTDAQIAVYNAKFKYAFWRPVTAIRTGAISPDPTWTPFFTTPRYPDWVSGHGGVTGAAEGVLTAFLGPETPGPIAVTSPTDPGVTHDYTSWNQISAEVIDARVWEGIHFRFSDVAGARLGERVAHYELGRLRAIGL